MITSYRQTTWVDNKTPINAENLNNIENGISNLYSEALSVSEIKEGQGIEIEYNRSGLFVSLKLTCVDTMPQSSTSDGNIGDYYIDSDNGFLYFCIQSDPGETKWIKIKLEDF